MRNISALLLVVVLSACATNTGFVQLTDDTYMYGKQDHSVWSGSEVKAEAYREAIAFCGSKGKKFEPISSTGNDAVLRQAAASAEIQFRCK